MKVPKQAFTAEFKELAVNRARAGQSGASLARELEVIEQTLRNWVTAAKAGGALLPRLTCFNREVIGWSIKPRMTAGIVTDALTMGLIPPGASADTVSAKLD